jgi:hypothetical protein
MKVVTNLLLAGLLLLPFLAGCAPPTQDGNRVATLEALAQRVIATATAAALTEAAEESGPEQAGALATQASAQQVATQTAAATVVSADAQATAEAERPIRAELPFFDVDPAQGRVGWIHPPLTLEVEGFNDIAAGNDFAAVVAGDFVISADITWNTRFGDSGCGFVVRSDGNQNAPSQYLFAMTRFANGHVGFAVLSKGELVNGHDLYPRTADRGFSAENDATNQLTVVGRGLRFQVYTNGVLIGEVDPTQQPVLPGAPPLPEVPTDLENPFIQATIPAAQVLQGDLENLVQQRFRERQALFKDGEKVFEKGFTSMVAVTNSGRATCTFSNAYLWLIEP